MLPAGPRRRPSASAFFVRAPPGPLRLAQGQLAAQFAWLLPFAAMAFVADAWRRLTLLFWLCWTATYAIVYSALGGIFHFYYLATLAPALAFLAGIGVVGLWTLYRDDDRRWYLLPPR
jgi:4-amino-4-deoxy-L-arabinose transferase-like glycosyltransferase